MRREALSCERVGVGDWCCGREEGAQEHLGEGGEGVDVDCSSCAAGGGENEERENWEWKRAEELGVQVEEVFGVEEEGWREGGDGCQEGEEAEAEMQGF